MYLRPSGFWLFNPTIIPWYEDFQSVFSFHSWARQKPTMFNINKLLWELIFLPLHSESPFIWAHCNLGGVLLLTEALTAAQQSLRLSTQDGILQHLTGSSKKKDWKAEKPEHKLTHKRMAAKYSQGNSPRATRYTEGINCKPLVYKSPGPCSYCFYLYYREMEIYREDDTKRLRNRYSAQSSCRIGNKIPWKINA